MVMKLLFFTFSTSRFIKICIRIGHVLKVAINAFFCLFVLEFYGPVNNEVMSSQSVNGGTVPGQA